MTGRMAALGVATTLALALAMPGWAYDVAPVAGGGTIKGKVVYNGRIPIRTVIPTKDQAICGEMREEPEVVVGPDKGVEDSIVYLASVPSGKPWSPEAKAPVVDNKACRFLPRVQAIPVGQLTIQNSDPVLHNTHGYVGRRTAFNVALPNQGQGIPVDVPRPGQIRVECDAHGWMLGWVYVVDNPYNVVTGKGGTFEITDVPPGEYTLVANQEFTGPVEIKVTVKSGETIEVPIELVKK